MFDINYLEQVAMLDHSELGETLMTLIDMYHYKNYLAPETNKCIEAELELAEKYYKEKYSIVDREEPYIRRYKELVDRV